MSDLTKVCEFCDQVHLVEVGCDCVESRKQDLYDKNKAYIYDYFVKLDINIDSNTITNIRNNSLFVLENSECKISVKVFEYKFDIKYDAKGEHLYIHQSKTNKIVDKLV